MNVPQLSQVACICSFCCSRKVFSHMIRCACAVALLMAAIFTVRRRRRDSKEEANAGSSTARNELDSMQPSQSTQGANTTKHLSRGTGSHEVSSSVTGSTGVAAGGTAPHTRSHDGSLQPTTGGPASSTVISHSSTDDAPSGARERRLRGGAAAPRNANYPASLPEGVGSSSRDSNTLSQVRAARSQVASAVLAMQGELQADLHEERLHIYRVLGRGGFGTVYHGAHRSAVGLGIWQWSTCTGECACQR